jgi:predicted MFS family arabinose efflux permease
MFVALGVRQTFGLFLAPVSVELGLGREVFAFSMALQQIMWGLLQPVAGMIADKYGAGRVLAVGGLFYAAGLAVMAKGTAPGDFHLGGGVLVGMSMAAVTFSVVLGAVGRLVADEKRAMALSIVAGGSAFGQVVMVPAVLGLLDAWGWRGALLLLALFSGLMVPCAAAFAAPRRPAAGTAPASASASASLGAALGEAARHRGYWLLGLGFFACGFQVTFIITHLPAYMTDAGMAPRAAAMALMALGIANIVGNYVLGYLGGRFRKKFVLSAVYVARACILAAYLAAPLSETSTMIFVAAMGFTWLGTIPLTGALVAQIFGARYMTSLFSIVFMAHQAGAFAGAWLGGAVYDAVGSYETMWIIAIGLGVAAALLHLPIADAPLRGDDAETRPAEAEAPA